MNLADIFARAILRRCWLLNKALENAPLDEALNLAQAVDDFLRGDQPRVIAPMPIGQALLNSFVPNHRTDSLVESTLSSPGEEEGDGQNSMELGRNGEEIVGALVVEVRDSLKGFSDDPSNELRGQQRTAPPLQAATEDSLLVSASLDDVVRYLRQRDDVVVPAGENTFLVNGRFRLNPDELVARANKMRQRQGKPLFQQIRANFSTTANAPHLTAARVNDP